MSDNGPLAYTVREAMAAARLGRTSLYEAIKAGDLQARKHGVKTLILADELRRYLQSLPTTSQAA